jgi:hypothetical protein
MSTVDKCFLKNVVNLSKLFTYIKVRYTFKLNTWETGIVMLFDV